MPLGPPRLFPNSTFVIVRNVGHVTALADYPGCAAGMVRRFLATLSPGDVNCAERAPEIHVVPEFPQKDGGRAGRASRGGGDRSTALDRRAAWGAAGPWATRCALVADVGLEGPWAARWRLHRRR